MKSRLTVFVGMTAVLLLVVAAIFGTRRAGSEQPEDDASGPAAPLGAHDEDHIDHYTCSMHTFVRKPEPGQCPVCNMDLVPVLAEEVNSGIVRVDADRRQLIGVRTGTAERRPLTRQLRAVGKVRPDETRVTDISLKYSGWIRSLRVDAPGQSVARGQEMFTIYSPELYSAQDELLATRGGAGAIRDAARRRLRLWDVSDAQIARIERTGRPLEALPIAAPAGGTVLEKYVVEGTAVRPGQRLYRIARLDRVWIEVDVFEDDLEHVAVGQTARVVLPGRSGAPLEGTVAFVYPYLDDATRSGRVRIEMPNPDQRLRPEMYAHVEIDIDLGEQLAVPAEAVLYVGARRLVFLDLGEGRLKPTDVVLGARAGDWFIVQEGLEAGDEVVTSGNFLIGAESRIKSGSGGW